MTHIKLTNNTSSLVALLLLASFAKKDYSAQPLPLSYKVLDTAVVLDDLGERDNTLHTHLNLDLNNINDNAQIKFNSLSLTTKSHRRGSKIRRSTSATREIVESYLFLYPLLNLKKAVYPTPHYYSLKSFWWYKFYLKSVTQEYLQFTSDWAFIECSQLVLRGLMLNVYRSVYNRRFLNKLYCTKDKFIFWFTKLTMFKDLSVFINMILKWLQTSSIRKHKRIFVLINLFLRHWYRALYEYNKIKGYCIFFKGKLGRKGSVRKSKYFAKLGEVSYSTKSLRVNYKTFQFGTITGCVGGGISLFY